jgi:hypothetical protein
MRISRGTDRDVRTQAGQAQRSCSADNPNAPVTPRSCRPSAHWSSVACSCSIAVRRVEDSLEPVEDQIEPEFELVRVVVARLQHVLDGHFHEVWIRVDGELAADAVGNVDGLLG